ncbi:hypothetical protein ACM9ER_003668 [Vibrio alginolyticus]|uniref:hypothetical protein n=1 Tax=Vibrio TaxID=662 RepID=UPI0006A79A07|nr:MULTISPECIES: hypothetical protein [Vibrio]EIP0123116.1 hypothetical protein [Vibrio alginolyticus]EJI1385110.1 hypothetical protein [Vibrio alginolyticus]PNP21537.1 hypothetical protein AL471_012010 [Vibrio alginolyticus]USD75325.1 hypothetical protein J4N43_06530 [Vibrio sp. SCSIO 43009]
MVSVYVPSGKVVLSILFSTVGIALTTTGYENLTFLIFVLGFGFGIRFLAQWFIPLFSKYSENGWMKILLSLISAIFLSTLYAVSNQVINGFYKIDPGTLSNTRVFVGIMLFPGIAFIFLFVVLIILAIYELLFSKRDRFRKGKSFSLNSSVIWYWFFASMAISSWYFIKTVPPNYQNAVERYIPIITYYLDAFEFHDCAKVDSGKLHMLKKDKALVLTKDNDYTFKVVECI